MQREYLTFLQREYLTIKAEGRQYLTIIAVGSIQILIYGEVYNNKSLHLSEYIRVDVGLFA